MAQSHGNTGGVVLIAIDVAKKQNAVLVQFPDGARKKFMVINNLAGYRELSDYLKKLKASCKIGFEATGNYHRALAYYLRQRGFDLELISSVAASRTREAMFNSWDKNDPKDAQVILHMLQTGLTQTYYDPLVHQTNDIQELSKTYCQVSLRKTRVQHSIMTHYLPLYFPEASKYFHTSRAEWFTSLLMTFPNPAAVLKYSREGFIRMRRAIEARAELYLKDNPDYLRLRTIPGIGAVIALIILAEAGNLRRFTHYKKFLKYCGLSLSTQQSGNFRGMSKLSKHGNSRLRYAFWIAGTSAIRMRENTFRKKYENYIKADPQNPDLKRKAYTAVAVKIARVAYGLVKAGCDYRCYHESSIPSGIILSASR